MRERSFLQRTDPPSSPSSAAPVLADPHLRSAGAQGKRPGWRPEPRREEGIGQFTSRRNGGSLDKATVTLVDRSQYCWPGTPRSTPGWEDGRALRPRPCPRQLLTQDGGSLGRTPPAPGELGFGGCQMAHPHPCGRQFTQAPSTSPQTLAGRRRKQRPKQRNQTQRSMFE